MRIINQLKEQQAKTGWLSDADLKQVSDELNVHRLRGEIYEGTCIVPGVWAEAFEKGYCSR